MERRVLLALVLGLIVVGIPLAVQSYALSKQLSSLEDRINLINQEIGALWEEISTLELGNSTNDTIEFTFTWGSNTQKIVQETFCLKIRLGWDGKNLTVVIQVNDDEYDPGDYIGLVFLNNDSEYESYGLFADNMTITPSFLMEHGLLSFPMYPPEVGPQKVMFDPKTGYTFTVQYPWVDQEGREWNPARMLKRGNTYTGWNILHVCFDDFDGGGVFVRFRFFLFPEEV